MVAITISPIAVAVVVASFVTTVAISMMVVIFTVPTAALEIAMATIAVVIICGSHQIGDYCRGSH